MRAPDHGNFVGQPAAGAASFGGRGARRLADLPDADGEVQALANVDLQIGEGDFVSFIGPSGCGKTTLLRVIADLERPTAGTILVNGVTPEQARLGRHYGYIFQAPALYPWRTIERNVALPLEIMGFDAGERRERVERYLKLVNLVRLRAQIPLAAVRRHAAARVDRARAVVRSGAVVDGRAVRRARRDRARSPQRAIAAAVGSNRQRRSCS